MHKSAPKGIDPSPCSSINSTNCVNPDHIALLHSERSSRHLNKWECFMTGLHFHSQILSILISFSMKPGTCFMLQVGVKASGTSKTMTFLLFDNIFSLRTCILIGVHNQNRAFFFTAHATKMAVAVKNKSLLLSSRHRTSTCWGYVFKNSFTPTSRDQRNNPFHKQAPEAKEDGKTEHQRKRINR